MAADGQHPDLHLVAPAPPSAREKLTLRIKRAPRPDGMLQCNRCGSRAVVTVESGVIIKNGRRKAGTVIEKDICAECWKGGIITPMVPQLKPIDKGDSR